ncbi:TetR/AcrR family transcriptional regulator [Parerythrobacter aestuarii]|uniref:TetR/AcrR family transcriptional regulator n=1 Tax=Parerythrobacter aestuarii TaxID=3020909 RepID=UPI0024DED47D|nr:TetR/AcrR family transcriptional regulator [Parerythrobacter aestuarii]
MRTKDRIVLTARQVFNRDGYGAVTTAALAEACGIAEGNLWYHFKTKRDLLAAIAEEFAERIEARLARQPDPADPLGSYCAMLGDFMQELRDYRFLYRDQPHYGEHVEPIASNVARWLVATEDSLEAHLAALVEAGLLDWERERLRDLAINSTIILRYGLEHHAELGQPQGAVRKSLLQHLTLFEARLDASAAREIRAAVERIGEEVKAAA